MDITPNDIRNFEFSNQLRGYDKEDVDSFLDKIAVALEEMKQENLKQSMEVDSVKTQLAGLREFEETIKSAAIDARRNADMTVATAKREGGVILSKARAEAEQIIESRTKQINDLEDQITKLEMSKKSYLGKLRSLINSHLDLIDEIASSEIKKELLKQSQEEDVEVIDSSEVERDTFETIATPPSGNVAIKTEEANAAEEIVPAISPTTENISTESATNRSEPEPSDDTKPEGLASEPQATSVSQAASESQPASEPQAASESPAASEPPAAMVDPELEVALQSYRKPIPSEPIDKELKSASQPEIGPEPAQPTPLPGQFVETTARAEDVPSEFFVKGQKDAQPDPITDRVAIERIRDQEKAETFDPTKIAGELDSIANKFVKEMDKADKS